MLLCWPLGCPLAHHCLSGHIEEEPHFIVVQATVWPSGAACFGHLVPSLSTLVLTNPLEYGMS
jgi:hypothetical protein